MGCVAIIPARGGSKRLPRKNVLPVLGKPMLTYPIKAAQQSRLFDDIFVSTEDSEIADVANSCGAKVVQRPEHLAYDQATVVQVCLRVLEVLEAETRLPDIFCCVYATALFLQPDDFVKAYELLNNPTSDFVMGVSEFNLKPLQALEPKGDFLQPMWPDHLKQQSQVMPRLLASNGTLYWARVGAFREAESFYGERLKGYEIPWIRAIDLDTPEDLEIAQILARRFLNGENRFA